MYFKKQSCLPDKVDTNYFFPLFPDLKNSGGPT